MIKEQNEMELFDQIYNNSHIGILVVDKKRTIIEINPQLSKMF